MLISGIIIGICIGFSARSLMQIFFSRRLKREIEGIKQDINHVFSPLEAQKRYDDWVNKDTAPTE